MTAMILKNGRVVHHDSIRREDVLIENGRIGAVGKALPAADGARIIDCQGKLIFPGIIDPHTHMGIPIKGGWSADDFTSGSRAALHGGVTTIIDFTILEPNQSLHDSIAARQRAAAGSMCDYHLHCNLTRFDRNLLAEIPDLIAAGVSSFKVFTTYREAGMMLSYGEIEQVAEVLAEHGGLLMVHAEDDAIITAAQAPLTAAGHIAPFYHGLSRPDRAEAQAVAAIAGIVERTGCPAYIVHLSSAAGLKAAAAHLELLLETCPQYLLLDESRYRRSDGRMYVASPPLRRPADNQVLRAAVLSGRISVIGTDHCPFHLQDKHPDIPFQDIPNGIGGVETLFPVLLAEFVRHGLDLSLLTRLLSTNAARVFGLYPRKGLIAPGSDADLVVVDPERVTDDWQPDLIGDPDWNAFDGFPAIFPELVIRRGVPVDRKGRISDVPPGEFIAAGSAALPF
ncbi:MAG: amidohydrolase family protein [Candidatus Neomarinimicrobiota bacterium]